MSGSESESTEPIDLTKLKESVSWGKKQKQEVLKLIENLNIEVKNLKTVADLSSSRDKQSSGEASSSNANSQIQQQTNERGFKLDANTPKYRGRITENVEKWITIVSNAMKAAGVSEEKKLYVITNYVEESAQLALLKYMRDTAGKPQERSITEFFTLLLSGDNAIARKNAIKRKLLMLKHLNMSFDDYVVKFRELAFECEMRDEDLVFFFISGLKQKTKGELEFKQPKTLAEAISMASILEQSMVKDGLGEEVRKAKVNMVKKTFKFNGSGNKGKFLRKRCIKCRRTGHSIADCKSQWKCLKCDEYGHKANGC